MIIALLAATLLMADSTTAMQTAPVAAEAPAERPQPTDQQKGQAKLAAGNTMICRNEPVLGSRLPTRRCRTAIQAAEERRDSQEAVEKLQRLDNPGNKN